VLSSCRTQMAGGIPPMVTSEPPPAENDDTPRVQALAKEVALLSAKLANAEDEYAALWSKTSKGEAREQERAARHHKAQAQLQKKVLSQAETARQLQRKLDDRDASLASALADKDAAWAQEREALSRRVYDLEQKNGVLTTDFTRSETQVQQLEVRIAESAANLQELEKSVDQWKFTAHNMNTKIQELEKSAAHWKATAEKRKLQAVDALAAQRSSDSRVVVLEAELKNHREDKLREKPVVRSEMRTQTEDALWTNQREVLRRDMNEWLSLVTGVVQACSDVAFVIAETREVGHLLQAQASAPVRLPVSTVDANIGTMQLCLHDVAVATDATPPAKHVDVQTEPPRASAEVAVQTARDVRSSRYHVECQTDSIPRNAGVSVDVQTDRVVNTAHAHREVATCTSPRTRKTPHDEELEEQHMDACHAPSSAVIKGEGEQREERWWRRSPMKAMPDGPSTPALVAGAEDARPTPLKIDVASLDKLRIGEDSTTGGNLLWPASPNTVTGTPHPRPGHRRHLAGSPPASLRSLIPPPAMHLQWPLGKQQHEQAVLINRPLGVVNVSAQQAVQDAALKRPLFRASESPLQVRLPVSPVQTSPAISDVKPTQVAILKEQLVAQENSHQPGSSSSATAKTGSTALKSRSPNGQACDEPDGTSPAQVLNWESSGEAVDREVEDDKVHLGMVELDQARVQSNIATFHTAESALLAGRAGRTAVQHQVPAASGSAMQSAQVQSEPSRPHAYIEISSTACTAPAPSPSLPPSAATSGHVAILDPVMLPSSETLLSRAEETICATWLGTPAADDHGPGEGARLELSDSSRPLPQPPNCPVGALPRDMPVTDQDTLVKVVEPIVPSDDGDGKSKTQDLSGSFATGSEVQIGDSNAHITPTRIGPEGKWVLGSPRDAVALLNASPHSSLKIRVPCPKSSLNVKTDEESPPVRTPSSQTSPSALARHLHENASSDSSDDETWNGFVARGLRPRLHRSLLDEAAGLSKTLSQALANTLSSHANESHTGAGNSGFRDNAYSGLKDVKSSGSAWGSDVREDLLSEFHQRLQRSQVNASSSSKTHDSPEAHDDLNGLLDEVRRATDRCERRKRMTHLEKSHAIALRLNQQERDNHGNDERIPEQDASWKLDTRSKSFRRDRKNTKGMSESRGPRLDTAASEQGRGYRQKDTMDYKFGQSSQRHAFHIPSSPLGFGVPSVNLLPETSRRDLVTRSQVRKLPSEGLWEFPANVGRSSPTGKNEVLKMMIGAGDPTISWSPIQPTQMAVLRSFLNKFDTEVTS
jgi:hypothetical protein